MMKRLFGDRDALANYAWFFVFYLMGVILFGAWVRITGSGAGCGDHWPTCHGEVIPIAPNTKTMIEFTHRVTSGLCGVFGLVLIVWSFIKRRAGKAFYGALITMAFIIIEALVGAGIVLKELVADDDSVARAIVVAIHLVNTLVLMGAASLTAWWAGGGSAHLEGAVRAKKLTTALLGFGVVMLLATSMSGAVTALGDTLFPVDPTLGEGLLARVKGDLSATRHFLVRLRVLHPVIAIFTAAYVLFLGNRMLSKKERPQARSWALILSISVVCQVLIGVVNIALAAPGWVQLFHLLVAQFVWISLVLLSASSLSTSSSASA